MPPKPSRHRRDWATVSVEERDARRLALLQELLLVGHSTPERIIQRLTDQFAAVCGWEWHHNPDSRLVPSGLPDSIYLAPPFLLFVEFKSATGTLKPAQATWVTKLNQVPSPTDGGVRAFIIYPDKLTVLTQILWKHGPLSRDRAWPTHLHTKQPERTHRASSETSHQNTHRAEGKQGRQENGRRAAPRRARKSRPEEGRTERQESDQGQGQRKRRERPTRHSGS